jgi:hypothetical protein
MRQDAGYSAPEQENRDSDEFITGGDDGNGEDSSADYDTEPDTASGVESETDKNTEDTETGSPGTEESPDGGDLSDDVMGFENVFISTPNSDGFVTIVGLPGSVTPDSSVTVLTNDAEFSITVGKDGGFADRIPAKPETRVTLVVTDADGKTSETDFITGDLNEQFANGIAAKEGQHRLTASLIAVTGEGSHLDGGYFVLGGNITSGSAAFTSVICHEETCRFSLVISAAVGDALDLFLVRNVGTLTSMRARTGTVSDRIIAE